MAVDWWSGLQRLAFGRFYRSVGAPSGYTRLTDLLFRLVGLYRHPYPIDHANNCVDRALLPIRQQHVAAGTGARASHDGNRHEEREQTLNQLLVEMDGFEASSGIIVMAATNRPDVLDAALLRPGRFDRQVVVPLPDMRGREEILRIHTRRMPVFGQQVVIEQMARATPGMSGAELEAICNEAAILAARDGDDKVFLKHFEQARDKIVMGVERKHLLSPEDKKRIAYHEAGHTLDRDPDAHAGAIPVSEIDRALEMKWFERAFKKEITQIEKAYGKENVELRWGILWEWI